ncbi:hypothetical protein lerEdw1_002236 [Lerista edwardsae]|nr:hypothetical protein lerEdw1_002237 [Lerista edwardsae]KAJ6650901.1 hypothetical protein lerEdw1_002236 [Lerista edwardsae]
MGRGMERDHIGIRFWAWLKEKIMDQKMQELQRREETLQNAIEALKKENKEKKKRLATFWEKTRKDSKSIVGRNRALWERHTKVWSETSSFLEKLKNLFKEDQELWKEDLENWKAEMDVWKKELDLWDENLCGRF